MALQFSTSLRNTWLDAITTAAGANAVINLYTGTKPANVAAALSGNTLLGTLTCGSTLAPAASGGVLTLNTITQDSSADATGTATFYRLATSGGTVISQGDVGTTVTDVKDFNLNTTSIVAGGPIQATSWTITAPGA